VVLRDSFFRDEDHGLLRVGGHDLFADEDIGEWLEVVNELGVIVGEQQIIVQSLGQIRRKFQLGQHVFGKRLFSGVYENPPFLEDL
jgi:hypothetical protein